MPKTVFAAAVDWGTSSFRLWLLAKDGSVLGERRSGEGMQGAGAGPGFPAVLESHLEALGAPADLPAIVCGMAGARQGWIEAPYADTPAGLAEIADGAVAVPGLARDVRILPGVAQRDARRPDVMRGEETILMGLGAAAEGLVCLPGTHSKWAAIENGAITGFSSFMTGETYALFAGQSVLKHGVEKDADPLDAPEHFDDGVRESLAEPGTVLNRLFALRADGLFGALSPREAASKLSGLLIGQELAGVEAFWPERRAVTLASSGRMMALYARALALAGIEVVEADADTAVRNGLLAAARRCFPI